MIERRWQQMVPLDILCSISDLLPMPDLIRFRSVCSSWHSAPSFRSNITKFVKYQPWLILYGFQNKKSDDAILLQLHSNVSCTLKLPILNSVLVSKLGWLLCHHGNHYFFYNPFTLEKFDLPHYQRPLKPETKQVATFSSPPNSEDCIVFVIRSEKLSEIEISWCRPLEKRWFSEILVIAGNNPLQTGEWPCAVYCSCEKDGSCKCKYGNKVLVWQSEAWMRYDIDNRVLQSGQRLKVNQRSWWTDLVDRRLDDILSNFVEKDANISFAPFNSTRSRALNLIPFDYKVKTGMSSGAEAAPLKAFWIEPEFPWR
ncbi:uncharacterized protein LOC110032126 [Phalaenopsis equestris]|uniref:uncharacterized protein LOC110032126 n=1 Tax=Phalaenopsis equestris TaxID=78828 RepID=UPI0009E53517|nr:uncharacterized protein LOC110032126 [Phalaenopsis equestris]